MYRRLDPDQLTNVAVLAALTGLVGARLYYVAFHWDHYGANPLEVFAIWEGGLALHGGLIAGGVAILLYCRRAGLSIPVTGDIFVPAIALGQAIGRWGNFFNQEAFGLPTTLPWRLYIDPDYRPPHLAGFEYFHPTFLYESLWNLLVFLILWFGLRKRLQARPGALTLGYLALSSVGRLFTEALRIDSVMLGSLRAAQVLSVVFLLGATLGMLLLRRTQAK